MNAPDFPPVPTGPCYMNIDYTDSDGEPRTAFVAVTPSGWDSTTAGWRLRVDYVRPDGEEMDDVLADPADVMEVDDAF